MVVHAYGDSDIDEPIKLEEERLSRNLDSWVYAVGRLYKRLGSTAGMCSNDWLNFNAGYPGRAIDWLLSHRDDAAEYSSATDPASSAPAQPSVLTD